MTTPRPDHAPPPTTTGASAAAPTTFTLTRQRNELRLRRARLARRDWITPGLVRIRLEGAADDEFRGFDSPGEADHVRVFVPAAGGELPDRDGMAELPSRDYTPLSWSDTHLDLEFVVHGDGLDGTVAHPGAGPGEGPGAGVASEWARSAPIGAGLGVGGPRGSLVLTGEPDAWLLAGDESALPAIRRYVRRMPPGALGRLLVESGASAHDLRLEAPGGVVVSVVAPLPGAPGASLARALDALTVQDRPSGDVFVFVAAEASIVPAGRGLVERWGVDPERVSVKGYWRRDPAASEAG